MTKKEIIWRYILYEAFNKSAKIFTQKELASRFFVSTSTVFNALKIPRKLGAIEVTGRFFKMRDPEKLLLIWATQRNLRQDIIYSTYVDMPVQAVEGSMPPDAIFGAFSAYRFAYHDAPADYSAVYVYSDNLEEIKKRFPKQKGHSNLFILKPDRHLSLFGKTTPDVQTYADLWNINEWYAKDYLNALRSKLLATNH